jgi:hypothetical protein
MTLNRATSIRARLKQRADADHQDFNLILTHYGLERLLYRLSISKYSSNFLLKGALLFTLWYDLPHRPTRDADLLGFGSDDIDAMVATFRNICQIISDDGVEFNSESVKGREIRKEAGYGGIRVDIQAKLDGARIALQIDIGFGDVVTPGPEAVSYPSRRFARATTARLSKHTVIAEKLQAICVLGMANSRMKDFFDLWVLLRDDLDRMQLRKAIEATFSRRKTPFRSLSP